MPAKRPLADDDMCRSEYENDMLATKKKDVHDVIVIEYTPPPDPKEKTKLRGQERASFAKRDAIQKRIIQDDK